MLRSEAPRLLRLFAGLTAYSVGIALTVQANIGLSPWDVFHDGVALRTGLTFGMASIGVSALIVLLNIALKEPFGIGTLFNVYYIGFVIDVLMLGGFIKESSNSITSLVMMVVGLVLIAFAMVLYMSSGYGAGPRDSLMVILSKRTGESAGFCRSVVEGIALLCGWLLGGNVGIGTVISVFGIGIVVQIIFTATGFNAAAVHQESVRETVDRIKAELRKE